MNRFIRYFIAIAMIGIGAMLLLSNLQLIDANVKVAWHYIYPIFFIIIGFILIYRYVKDGKRGWMIGFFLIVLGLLLLLGRLQVIDFFFPDVWKLWPLLIIYIGLMLIGNKQSDNIHQERTPGREEPNSGYTYQDYSIGKFAYDQKNWKVEPMEMKHVVGDFKFDFTKTVIPEEEIPISVHGWAGDVQILLPKDVNVRIDTAVRAGSIRILEKKTDGINKEMTYETPGYSKAVQKLKIQLHLKAGAIQVDQVENSEE